MTTIYMPQGKCLCGSALDDNLLCPKCSIQWRPGPRGCMVCEDLKDQQARETREAREAVEHPEEIELRELALMLGFCACGPCDSALKFVRDIFAAAVELRKQRDAADYPESLVLPTSDIAMKLNIREGAVGVVVNLLDDHDLVEHGGSLCLGWLTPAGENFRQRLMKALPYATKEVIQENKSHD